MTKPAEDDDFATALAEAEELMGSLTSGSNTNNNNNTTEDEDAVFTSGGSSFDDFAIDSDDEDDDDALVFAVKDKQAPVEDHPLAALANDTPAAAPSSNNNSNNNTSTRSSILSSSIFSATPFSSATTATQPQQQQPQQHPAATMNSSTINYSPAQPATVDAWKQQTSRFASNLASMAQRAVTSVTPASSAAMPHINIMPTASTASLTPNSSFATSNTMNYSVNSMHSASNNSNMNNNNNTGSNNNNANNGNSNSNNVNNFTLQLDKDQKQALIKKHFGDLLSGEKVIMFLAPLLHVSDSTGLVYNAGNTDTSKFMWCCVMTFYRLIMFGTNDTDPNSAEAANVFAGWNSACTPPPASTILNFPLASIERVEKAVFNSFTGTTLMGLALTGKDGRQIRFTTPIYADTIRAFEAFQTYAFPGKRNLGYLFAFESKREQVMASVITDEKTQQKSVTLPPVDARFEPLVEFHRQFKSDKVRPWKVYTNVNVDYQLCASYPSMLVGPATLDENMPDNMQCIQQCAQFRSENRLPTLTWSNGVDGASIWRASQPKVGLQGNRSIADEMLLKHILEAAQSANALVSNKPSLSQQQLQMLTGSYDTQFVSTWLPDNNCALKILDLRPRSAAMANRTSGYGYENTTCYPGTTLQFCNIGNIHAVRDSWQKMTTLCTSTTIADNQWPTLVEDTKWLSHIRNIWAAAWECAYWVHVHRLPVLVHCSHGWDRTSQVVALSQLLLDPYFRTRKGFACLVEKDFMSFGHPFHTRCAHGEGKGIASGGATVTSNDDGQVSPIFMQFLDCVYQLVALYPECFEFTTEYLLMISEHVYSCRFGTFLCDSERERERMAGIRQRTHSLWDYLETQEQVMNKLYDTNVTGQGVLLMPLPTLLRNIHVWVDRHLLYGAKPTLRWSVQDRQSAGIATKGEDYSQISHLRTLQNMYSQVYTVTAGTTAETEVTKDTNDDDDVKEDTNATAADEKQETTNV